MRSPKTYKILSFEVCLVNTLDIKRKLLIYKYNIFIMEKILER